MSKSTQKTNVVKSKKNETPKTAPPKIKEEVKDNFEAELAWCIDQLGFYFNFF
jgi:hypothetical protein